MSLRHRAFAYLLLLRAPKAIETEEIDLVLGWLARHWFLLLIGYLVLLAAWASGTGDQIHPLAPPRALQFHLDIWLVAAAIATLWFVAAADASLKIWRPVVAYIMLSGAPGFVEGFVDGFADGRSGALTTTSVTYSFDVIGWAAFVMVAYFGIARMVAHLRRKEIVAVDRALLAEAAGERLARQTAESELRLLQAQVQPHFLYNTLSNLRYLVQKGSPDALA